MRKRTRKPHKSHGPRNARAGVLARLALSDLLHRKAAALINLGAVAVAGFYVLLLGFYAHGIWRYQRGLLEQQMPSRIIVSAGPTDLEQRFTAARMAELEALPGVARVAPQVELNVELLADAEGRRQALVLARGAEPGDPALSARRLLLGRGFSGDAALEAVLSRQVFLGSLGGRIEGGLPVPGTLTLEVSRRNRDGRTETRRHEVEVVGLMRAEAAEGAWLPMGLIAGLDRFCTGHAEPAPPAMTEVRYASCQATASPEKHERVMRAATDLGVFIQPRSMLGDAGGEPVLTYAVADAADGSIGAGTLRQLSLSGLFDAIEPGVETTPAGPKLPAHKRFSPPGDDSAGHLRVQVDAATTADAERLVAELQQRGYHTEDRLHELRQVERLGAVLAAVVGLFAFGVAFNAALSVLITGLMNVRTRIHEIGILRTAGMGARQILTMFAIQGLAIALGATAAALGLALLLEPLLRPGVMRLLRIMPEVFQGPGLADMAWLWGATAGVAVLFSLGGMLLPAAYACHIRPLDALRQKE